MSTPIKSSEIESELLLLVKVFLMESMGSRVSGTVTLNSSLDKYLAVDSLAKVEFLHRVEKRFHIQLPVETLIQDITLQDLATLIIEAKPKTEIIRKVVAEQLAGHDINLSDVTTLVDALIKYGRFAPKRPNIYLQDETGKELIITYGDLLSKASMFANNFIAKGIKAGETIAVMLPTESTFFFAFFGVLLAGAIPVPIYPPFKPDEIEVYAIKEVAIFNSAEIRILMTFAKVEGLGTLLKSLVPSLREVLTIDDMVINSDSIPKRVINKKDPMLIQYTSGSTGDPKGVLLTHNNMVANIKAIRKALKINPEDVIVSWLPLYHDMGLMSWLAGFHQGIPIVILSPLTFLNRPEKWLWAIHSYKGTLSAAPNFAYELCVKRIASEDINGLDLSSWRYAFNGAEVVHPNTLIRFYNKFARYGFKKESLKPVYGLAENTVALCFPSRQEYFDIDKVKKEIFEKQGIALPAKPDEKPILEFVSVGNTIPDHQIRVVDDNYNEQPERYVGNVQFKGPSAMQGYYRNYEATAKVYHDGWWDTGDLGYIVNENLYLCGRKKDLIIKAGRNIYPEMIEGIVGDIQGIRKGCVVAFGLENPKTGTEKILIAAETNITDSTQRDILRKAIIDSLLLKLSFPPDEIIFMPPKSIPKTSSGKLQRQKTKELYLNNTMGKKKSVQLQLLKLIGLAFATQIKHLLKQTLALLYTLYAAIIFILTFLPMLVLSLISTKQQTSYICKYWAKTFLMLIFCRVKVFGKQYLKGQQSYIFAANHCSYSDSLILVAHLPINTVFLAKKELFTVPILRFFMKKLNCVPLDRKDYTKNLADLELIKSLITAKNSILIFPEGTFSYASGLRLFKNGAFQMAVDTNTPICAISFNGTRKFLRSGSWLLTPTHINMTVCAPVMPETRGWQEVARLHNVVRYQIAKYCGEPNLGLIYGRYDENLPSS